MNFDLHVPIFFCIFAAQIIIFIAMFTSSYFWLYVAACLTSSPLVVISNRTNNAFLMIIGLVCTLGLLSFLITGFWFMPKWWMPLVMFGIGWLIKGAGAAIFRSIISAYVFSILTPVLIVLAYLQMLGVI